jgi:hypothetical protein
MANNIASNEDIRRRWNGHTKNQSFVLIYKIETTLLERINHILFGKMPPSKLEAYGRLV